MIGAFLEALWAAKSEAGFILIWRLAGKESFWCRDAAEAIRRAEAFASDGDIYVGTCLSPSDNGPGQRCKAEEVLAACGLWLDVDVAHAVHRKKGLPATEAEARALVEAMGPKPTALVHTGHGLQAWWLFTEPWTFDAPEERSRFAALSQAWQDLAARHARNMGFSVDGTGDLARILRIPGTMNRKDPENPVQARLLSLDGPRYVDWSTFESLVGPPSAAVPTATAGLIFNPQANPPVEKLDLLKQHNRRFKRTWERHREDMKDQSASAYCFSLAIAAAKYEWSDQEIVDLQIAWRRKESEDLKIDRPDWYARDLNKVREAVAKQQRYDEALEDLKSDESPQDKEEARAAVLKSLSTILNLDLARFVQYSREDVVFHFETVGGEKIEIGDEMAIQSVSRVRGQLLKKTSRILSGELSQREWLKVLEHKLFPVVEIEDPEVETIEESFRDKVVQYLSAREIYREGTEEGWEPAMAASLPFIRDERVYLRQPALRVWMVDHLAQRVSPGQVGRRLKAIGFETCVVRWPGKDAMRRYYRADLRGFPEIAKESE